MAQATCPSCRTEQTLPRGATGYRCVSCGREWSFSVCAECGGRFHARPGVGAWTCPRCGTRNVGTGNVPAAPERIQLSGPPGRTRPRWPSFMVRGSATYPTARPSWAPVATGASAAIVVFILLRVFVFDNGAGQAQPSAMSQMCLHLNEFQVQRVGALRRGADLLVGDAAALRAAGDEATAKKVDRLVSAARVFANALNTTDSADDAAALTKMSRARTAMPC
jgi:LSD1 subclass zinc finger protein